MSNYIKIFVAGWIAVVVTVLTVFGLIKIGSKMFDSTAYDNELCWKSGGVPEYDTKGSEDDFAGCEYSKD